MKILCKIRVNDLSRKASREKPHIIDDCARVGIVHWKNNYSSLGQDVRKIILMYYPHHIHLLHRHPEPGLEHRALNLHDGVYKFVLGPEKDRTVKE